MNKNFRFKLNLFDGIVLVIGLVAVAVLASFMLKSDDVPEATPNLETIHYTVRIESAVKGTGEQIKVGQTLNDSIKNYNIGTVESVEVTPARTKVFNESEQRFVVVENPEMEDIYITLTAPGSIGAESVVIDGGYTIKVCNTVYIRGVGVVGYGPVLSIERGEN